MQLTADQFKQVLPANVKIRVTDTMVDKINGICTDPKLRENFRENLLSYTSVMNDGKYKLDSYLSAVMFVSYKLLGDTNTVAYAKTFPARYQRLIDEGCDDKTISSYSTAFNKTKLVQAIVAQTLTPVHVLNADVYQKAINVQATLMLTANSENVRTLAANSIMTQLRPPEAAKLEIDITHKKDDSINVLQEAMREMASQYREKIIEGGITVKEAAHTTLNLTEEKEGEYSE